MKPRIWLSWASSVVFSLTCVTAAHAQIVDKPPARTEQPSYWGVLGGATPKWWLPVAWGPVFQDATMAEGRELRIGLRRGKPLGYEFGFSFVRKSMTRFTFEREGGSRFVPGQEPWGDLITYSELETIQIPGIEYFTFIPFRRIGSRVQLGTLLSFGAGHVPSTLIRKRIEGPPFFAVNSFPPLETLPAEGGLVIDERGGEYFVAPGQTGVNLTASIRDITPNEDLFLMIRGQIAADVLVAPSFKLRFSGGFNYPGAQLFGIEGVYLFGKTPAIN